jgi:hypothetical protein
MWWGKGEGNGEGRRAWEIGIKEGGRWFREKGGEGKGEWGKRTSNVVHVLVHYYIHPALSIFMRCYVGDGECF